jgi:hypothetical protein
MPFAPFADVPAALQSAEFRAPPAAETAMLVFNGRTVFELNLVSAFVWDLLRVPRGIDELVEIVTTVFGVDRATAEQDIVRLSESCLQQNLLDRVS